MKQTIKTTIRINETLLYYISMFDVVCSALEARGSTYPEIQVWECDPLTAEIRTMIYQDVGNISKYAEIIRKIYSNDFDFTTEE